MASAHPCAGCVGFNNALKCKGVKDEDCKIHTKYKRQKLTFLESNE